MDSRTQSTRGAQMGSGRRRPGLAGGPDIPAGLYCLRIPEGEWAPHVICLMEDGVSADLDYLSGAGKVTALGRWQEDEANAEHLVIDDQLRGSDGRLRRRRRRLIVGQVAGRTTLTLRPQHPGPGPLPVFMFATADTSVESETPDGAVVARPIQSLMAEFHAATDASQQQRVDVGLGQTQPLFTPPTHEPPQAAPQAAPRRKVAAVDSPYLTNPFRVLSLPTTADSREIGRRARELSMHAQLDGDEELAQRLRDAEAALADPVRRFTEELLWLRSGPRSAPPDIDPQDGAAVRAALALLNGPAHHGDVEATHDLAVLAHAAALENAGAPADTWSLGLAAWGVLFASDPYWRTARLRAELAGDARLTGQVVESLRASLPRRLLDPTARAIGQLVVARRDDDAAAYLAAVMRSGLPSDEVLRVRATATASLRAELSAAEKQLDQARAAFSQTGDARQLLAAATGSVDLAVTVLERLARLDPDSPEAQVRADELAEAVRIVSVRLHNDGDDTTGAAGLAQRAASIARSESVRSRLTADSRMLWRLAAQGRANELAGRENWAGAARELTVALRYTDDAETRADIERSRAICQTNDAMRRAVAAAQARDWGAAIAAAQEARATTATAQDRANVDAFIARCHRAANNASTERVKSVLGGIIGVAVFLFIFFPGVYTRAASWISPATPTPAAVRQAPTAPPPTAAPKPTQPPSTAPPKPAAPTTTPISLANGANIQPPVRTGGRSFLSVSNGTQNDAVVKLVQDGSDATVRFVYVRASSTVRLEGIEPGVYQVRFATGADWDANARKFRRDARFTKFREPFSFTETRVAEGIRYTTGEITLNPVRGGNAQSDSIGEGEF